MSRTITSSLLVGMALALIAWDIVVAVNDTPRDTISEVVLGFAGDHPVLPFALGVVMGHLLWPQRVGEGDG